MCIANDFSQSKVTGLLVEEALRSRGVLNESFSPNLLNNEDFININFAKEIISKNNKYQGNGYDYTVDKKSLPVDIKMIHEFIEFKYFKKVMKQNNNIFEL